MRGCAYGIRLNENQIATTQLQGLLLPELQYEESLSWHKQNCVWDLKQGTFDQLKEDANTRATVGPEVRGEKGIRKSLYLHLKCYFQGQLNHLGFCSAPVASHGSCEVHPGPPSTPQCPEHNLPWHPVGTRACFPAFPRVCSCCYCLGELYIQGIILAKVCPWRCHLNAEHLIALVKQNKPVISSWAFLLHYKSLSSFMDDTFINLRIINKCLSFILQGRDWEFLKKKMKVSQFYHRFMVYPRYNNIRDYW